MIKEFKQENIPEVEETYLTERQVRALIDESLTNMNANMRVLSGQITNQSGNVSITPTGTSITALDEGSLINIQGWTFSGTFSASDADTVAWTSGTITLGDGTAFSISAGNTGDMAALTYIYFDKGTSETVLQITTTASTAVGANKILICVAEDSTDEAIFQVFGGSGGLMIDAGKIADAAVTAAKTSIAAINAADGEINANKVGTTQIDALAVTEAKIAASAVAEAKIAASAVTEGKISALAVTAGKIASNAITSDKIYAGAVTANKLTTYNFILSEGSFTDDSPTAGSVAWTDCKVVYNGTEYEITDGNSDKKHIYWQLASPTVFSGSDTLPALGNDDFLVSFNDSGTNTLVWNSTVINGNRITAGSVVASNLAAGTITANEIATNAITSDKINALAVTAAKIAANTITTNQIAANTIVAGNIAANTITSNEIAANTITANNMNVSQLSAISANLGSITSGTITSATFQTAASGARFFINTSEMFYYNGTNYPFFVCFTDSPGAGDTGDVGIGNQSGKHLFWDNSAGTLSITGKLETESSGRRVVLDPSSSNIVQLYSGSTLKGSIGLGASDDDLKVKSESNDVELKVPAYRSIGFYQAGTREMLCNADGDFITRSNNTNQVGTEATAWKEVAAYNFNDRCVWLDDRDDLAILNATKPRKDKKGKIMRDKKGLPKLDHYSLPDWIHTGDKLREEVKRKKPELEARLKEIDDMIKEEPTEERLAKRKTLEEEYSNYDLTEEEIIDRTGRNLGHFVDLVAGAVRQLDKKVEDLKIKNKL